MDSFDSVLNSVNSKDLALFKFKQLEIATNDFALVNKLGQGGFGPVYKVKYFFEVIFYMFLLVWSKLERRTQTSKQLNAFDPSYQGILEDGQGIAVKRLSSASGQGLQEFVNEVVVISKLQHKNLVKLLGCCVEREEKILVYEFMPNKSLDALLFGKFLSS